MRGGSLASGVHCSWKTRRNWLSGNGESSCRSASSLSGGKGSRADTKVLVGDPFLEVTREVLRHGHDLVMMTAEGKGGVKEWLFGATRCTDAEVPLPGMGG